jgi:DNA-binding MarR family transcriptional regulator
MNARAEHPTAAPVLARGAARLARRLRVQRPAGMPSPTRLAMLEFLERHGESTPGELAAAHNVRPQSVTRILSDLEENGLIERKPSVQDRRSVVLRITELGADTLAAQRRHGEDWLAEVMTKVLTGAEIEILAVAGELMNRLADHRE